MVQRSREPVPSEVGGAASTRVKAFCSRLLKSLAPPLLREVESANALRAEAEPFIPRRSVRLSAPSPAQSVIKQSKKPSAAESALFKALGINLDGLSAGDEAIRELKEFFDSPIRDRHLHLLAAIFGKSMPPRHELLRMGSTEVCVSA
jgi:hypothetical protein